MTGAGLEAGQQAHQHRLVEALLETRLVLLVATGRIERRANNQHSTVQHSNSAVQHSIVQYSIMQHSTVQHSIVQHNTVQHGIVQQNTVVSASL